MGQILPCCTMPAKEANEDARYVDKSTQVEKMSTFKVKWLINNSTAVPRIRSNSALTVTYQTNSE